MTSFDFPGACYEVLRQDYRDLSGETDFLASYLPDGGRALDLGCGTGTNLRALAERGYRGVGVDHSPSFVDYARAAGGDVEYVHADLAEFDTDQRFDLVYTLFATLNLLSHKDLGDLLGRARRWLNPGGHLVVDAAHLLNFVDGFQPTVVSHHRRDGLLITRLARQLVNPHAATWRNEETLIVRGQDGVVSMYANFFDQTVLTAPELRDLVARAGFTVTAEFGGFRKEPPPRAGRGPLLCVAQAG